MSDGNNRFKVTAAFTHSNSILLLSESIIKIKIQSALEGKNIYVCLCTYKYCFNYYFKSRDDLDRVVIVARLPPVGGLGRRIVV